MYFPVDIKMKIHQHVHTLKLKEVHAELINAFEDEYILLHPEHFNIENVMEFIQDYDKDLYYNPDYELVDNHLIILNSTRHPANDELFKEMLNNAMNVIQKYKNKIQLVINNKQYYKLTHMYDKLAYEFAYCFYIGSD